VAVIVDREMFARGWAKSLGLPGHPDFIEEGRKVYDLTREIQKLQELELEAKEQADLFERSGSWWNE